MPFINIKMAHGRSAEQKQQLVEAITREVARTLDVDMDWITVVIDEYPRDNWATGGQLHSVKYGDGFGRQGTKR
ncbi:MAG: 4-oxalocrotonate tautomerase family protein [Firmicutes bacterium]|nr:4-oxalocrotonate tautomerase family protein [Bacillota bacterium]